MPIGLLALLLIDALLFVATALLMPKPKLQGISPTFPDRPTSKEGNPIPVIFGSVLIPANVTHFSNITAVEQTEKIKTGIFSSHRVTVGYSYSAVMQILLCHGPVNELLDIVWQDIFGLNDTNVVTIQENIAGKFSVRTENQDYTDPSLPILQQPTDNGTEFIIFADELFGGYKHGGGVQGLMRMFWGTQTQNADATLAAVSPVIPASPQYPRFQGIAHVVFGRKVGINPVEPFNFGEFGTVPPLAFLVRRCPSGLGLGAGVTNINGGANPAECIYEVLTNTVWGLMVPGGEIETSTFISCANALASEGFGINLALNQEESGDSVITELLRYVDGQVQQNPVTGKLEMTLNRADYDVTSLLSLDDTNSDSDLTRPAWTALVNQIKVTYTGKRGAKFVSVTTQPIDDIAAQREFGVVHSVTIPYLGVQDAVLANRLAVRDLRRGATPLQRARIRTNRNAAGLKVGAPFKLTNAAAGVNNHVFRVMSINFGTRNNGQVDIEAIEDIFNLESPFYNNPIDPPASWIGVGPVGPVRVLVDSTHDETTGYMELTIAGGGGLVTGVQFQEKSGSADITAWHDNITADKFFTEVDLDEKHPSLIGWRVLGHLKDGAIGNLAEGEANYPISTRPAKPTLSYKVHTSGWADLIIDVDQDAVAVKYLISYDHVPTVDEVLSQAAVDLSIGERRITVIDAIFLDTINPTAFAGVVALDETGNAGPIATLTLNAINPSDYTTPEPIFGPVEVEATSRGDTMEGMMHIPIQFEFNTDHILIYASEAPYDPDLPPPAPDQKENFLSQIITRHEGDIARADDWKTEADIAITTGFSRRIICLPVGPTGIRGEPFIYYHVAEDVGTPPAGPPTDFTVIMSEADGKARAVLVWIPGDSPSHVRIHRNGIILARLNPGVTELIDTGLSPENIYTYKIEHIRNGQTSDFPDVFEVGSVSPQLLPPTWQSGYPRGAGYQFPFDDPPSPGRCQIRCDNPDTAAFTVVWMTDVDDEGAGYVPVGTIPPGGHEIILNAEDMPGSDPTDEFRWFHLTSQRSGYVDSNPSDNERSTFGSLLI